MTDVVSILIPHVREALAGVPGGSNRRGLDNADQPVPSWWLQEIASSRLNNLQDARAVELHLWESSRTKLQAALERVEHLRDYRAGGVTFNRESSAVVQEDVSIFHATLTYSCPVFAGFQESQEVVI